MPNYLNRRRQPQVTLQAIKDVLGEIHWHVNQTTSQKFISASGAQVNESFGYELKIPKEIPLRELWIGYLNHQQAKPGIYAGLTPQLSDKKYLAALDDGYRESPFRNNHILFKEIIPIAKAKELEAKFGLIELKKHYKVMLLKNYPFSVARRKK